MLSFSPLSTGGPEPARSGSPTELQWSLLTEYARTRDRRVRDRLIDQNEWLVRHLAGRFGPTGGATSEDLVQVAYLGLIAAIERFDPSRGISFTTFALPTIIGEIKRFLRDSTWMLKAPRRLRELGLTLRKMRVELEQRFDRPPTIQELAEAAGVTEERVLQAMDVDRIYRPGSLDAQLQDDEKADRSSWEALGSPDPGYAAIEQREMLRGALDRLDPRQQVIIYYRFYEESTQAEVARRLGISQMHVSRLERQALQRLKALLA